MRIARCTGTGEDPATARGVESGRPGRRSLEVLTGDPLYPPVRADGGERIPLADVRLLAPVIPRSKVVGIGRNYADHAARAGQRRCRRSR